jgi:16S rRNA (adenine1518-N6/adenine1519-N6)-dimethyltransferase
MKTFRRQRDPVRAKKRLGQHFLTDDSIAQRIVASVGAASGTVLEVGAGTGALTRHLLAREDIQLFAVEADPEATAYLKKTFPLLAPKLFCEDFLRMDLAALTADRISIVGNFPYNISSQIFFKVLECNAQVSEVVCMLQKEVAERLAAAAGSRTCGILSVLLQAYYDVEYLFTVDSSVFSPPPKVQSGVIRLLRNGTPQLPCDERLFRQIVKMAFNQRRKTLRNSLRTLLPDDGCKSLIINDLQIMGMRPEHLSVGEFVELTNEIGKLE